MRQYFSMSSLQDPKQKPKSNMMKSWYLAKLLYFTNLDFPEITGFPSLNQGWGRMNLTRWYIISVQWAPMLANQEWPISIHYLLSVLVTPYFSVKQYIHRSRPVQWHGKTQAVINKYDLPVDAQAQSLARRMCLLRFSSDTLEDLEVWISPSQDMVAARHCSWGRTCTSPLRPPRSGLQQQGQRQSLSQISWEWIA